MYKLFLLLILSGCVAAPEIRACQDACGLAGVKKSTMISCQCQPTLTPCK